MLKDWLLKQLTPAKQESEIWQGYVSTLQTMYEQTIEPITQRIDNRKSFFTMDVQDLDTRINELGQFFAIRAKSDASKPILLAQRLDEIHFKGTSRPITATFWREFENIPAKWEPLYAPIDQSKKPYGELLIPENQIPYAEQTYGEFFLTSRGMISLSLNSLYELYGAEKQSELVKRIQAQYKEIIEPLLPLDIVSDGFLLYLEFTLLEYALTLQPKQYDPQKAYDFLNPANKSEYPFTTVFDLSTLYGSAIASPFKEKVPDVTKFSMAIAYSDITLDDQYRTLEKLEHAFDEMPLDAWVLDCAVERPIFTHGNATDGRISQNGTQAQIQSQGVKTLLVTYEDGSSTFVEVAGKAVVTVTLPLDGNGDGIPVSDVQYSLN